MVKYRFEFSIFVTNLKGFGLTQQLQHNPQHSKFLPFAHWGPENPN